MLSEKYKDKDLNAISQHNIVNAFDQIVLGNHPAGLNVLIPAEILYHIFLGVAEYTLSGFVNLYSKKGFQDLIITEEFYALCQITKYVPVFISGLMVILYGMAVTTILQDKQIARVHC